MGMGIVNTKEFESELRRNQSIPNPTVPSLPSIEKNTDFEKITPAEILDAPSLGRGKNNVEVPNALRQIIGETAAIEGRSAGLDIAKQYGISPSSVSAYTKGATSTASMDVKPNLDFLNGAKTRVAKRAKNKLMSALSHITESKLADAKVGEIASVAKAMSSIIKDMEPPAPPSSDGNNNPANQFIFYAPHYRNEESYDVVIAKE